MIALTLCAWAWAADAPREVMPDRAWDIQHLDLAVRVFPEGRIEGTAVHTVAPIGRPNPSLRLHQVGLEVDEVQVDGTPTDRWNVAAGHIDIAMPMEGDSHSVSIRYSATPQTGLHFRGQRRSADATAEVWSQGENQDNRHWFPGWDHPSDTFTVSQTYTVPPGWEAFGNGVRVDSSPVEGGWTQVRYQLDQPIVNYLVVLAAGEYTVVTDDRARVPLEYVVSADVNEDVARRTLGSTPDQLAYFEDLLGTPYPYGAYRQIIVQRFLYGGMENASATILSDRVLRTTADTPWYGTESVVAHELAHQWFGDLLTCYGWRELWLNEGFATYYAWRWMEHLEGSTFAAGDIRRNHVAALRDARPMAARGWSRSGDADYASQYVRGISVLHMLESLLGRDVFDRAIRSYVADNAHRLVESDDLRRALEDASGHHLGWLFDQYVYDNRIPALETSWSWTDGSLEIVIRPTPPEGDPEPRHAFVDIELGTHQGVLTRRVWVGDGAARLVLELDEAPRWVAPNATGGTLATWSHEQPIKAWIAQLDSPSEYARWEALEHLDSDAATPALVALLSDRQEHLRMRARAARALATLGSPAGLDALTALADAPTPPLRRAIAGALGQAPPTAEVLRALRRLIGDRDPDVRAAALRGLGEVDGDRAAAFARGALAGSDPTVDQVVHVAAASVLGSHGELSDISRLLSLMAERQPKNTRHSAARAAVSLATDAAVDEPPYARVSRVLEPFLVDPDLRTRQLGVALLAKAGDEPAARRLVAFAATNNVPRLSGEALGAANRIRSRGPAAPATAPDDDQRITERLEALEERLEALERWR
ncbi:MAG: aminopeptidase N [Myxococcota bacterium]